jgi:hypothetical protein
MTTTNARRTIPRSTWTAALVIAISFAPLLCSAGEISIRIAPSTLNLQSHGKVVTVHTDVPYGQVDVHSVFLGGVAISSWKAYDRGYFVAKFRMDDVKTIDGLVINGLNTLQFLALTIDGEPLSGSAEVMVIDRGPTVSPSGRRSETD